ncbi:hypothetical protein [Agromyces mangrovi Wang et al. 2018]|uniref:hypothetical protein n=1 Tax=Agromyces mangrovi TaxID=1858653 RepID=UPI0025740169|nr:hypothetical protein [Agromyces mangrovi]BDZ65065.1 hypothetical protein GCM10025877_20030 [Agromyces mangrovi]
MPELDDLLAEARADEAAPPSRRARIALIAGVTGGALALLAGSTLGVSAATSLALVEARDAVAQAAAAEAGSAARPASDVEDASVEDRSTSGPGTGSAASDSKEPADEPATAGVVGPDDPIYDASTDISTIPRPPADWPASELEGAEIWLAQQGITADCMLEQGFAYEFTPSWLRTQFSPTAWPAYSDEYDLALWGPNLASGADYDWRNAGCVGYAVHVTGMDDAN